MEQREVDTGLRDDILRVITRRTMNRGQHLLFKLLLEAPGDGWVGYQAMAERVFGGDRRQFAGLLAALAKRVNNTPLATAEKPGLGLVQEYRQAGDWEYRARPELRAAIEALPALAERLALPWSELEATRFPVMYRASGLSAVPQTAAEALSTDGIVNQYTLYRGLDHGETWQAWRTTYLRVIERFAAMDDAALASPQGQRALWTLRELISVGPGESVGTEELYEDAELAAGFVRARAVARDVTLDAPQRARTLQEIFEALRERAAQACRVSPTAKLARAFAALLPRHVHCGIRSDANIFIARQLGVERAGLGTMERRVLAMHRLDEVLGPPEVLAEQADRSMLCWWLYQQSIEDPVAEDVEHEIQPERTGADEAPGDVAPLNVWGFHRQNKSLPGHEGMIALLRDVVRCAQEARSHDEVVELLLAEDEGRRSAGTWRSLLINAERLGLVERQGGGITATEAGLEMLDGTLPDALVQAFIERWYGPVQVLNALTDAGGSLSRDALVADMQARHEGWSSRPPPLRVIAWLRGLGLLADAGTHAVQLTDYGATWARRIPSDLKEVPPRAPEAHTAGSADTTIPAPAVRSVPLAEIEADLAAGPLVVAPAQLRLLHLAWHALDHKRFVIFSGLSGTGKTALVRAYAHATCQRLGLNPAEHLAVVPVSPDWRDPAGLLGYLNPLRDDPSFHREPALDLVLHAVERPEAPHFLLLDEMNLARVERYFAPFLSAMETGEPLRLHAFAETVDGVPPWVPWPRNLFIAGTVNMDESTHGISDKVLDRAFTLEFWEVDLDAFFATRSMRLPAVEARLRALHDILRPVRRHFGYRTAAEVLALVGRGEAEALDAEASRALLDHALFAKVLPRIRGQESAALRTALANTRSQLADLPLCNSKLEEMEQRLSTHGVTQFWS